MTTPILSKLNNLPPSFPQEGAVKIELVEGIPIFRASQIVQTRIETLLNQEKTAQLTQSEHQELDLYEEIDDYLSLVNRTIRNLCTNPIQEVS
jgi:uncharacterized protein YnzC (UPF0291/DUF896 family)